MQSPPRVEVQAAARVSLLPTVACRLKVQAAQAEDCLKPVPEVQMHEESSATQSVELITGSTSH